jgi:DNA-binding beta-propeller fold protein YncE
MTAAEGDRLVALFVTNVLNGTVSGQGNIVNRGTVVRLLLQMGEGLPPQLIASTVIAADFPERTDPAALVIGPTGVAFDSEKGVLYVADSLENRIAAIPDALSRKSNAGIGRTVSQGGAFNDPLGLALTPSHRLMVANGNDGNIIEVNPDSGKQVAVVLVDSTGGPPPGAGALFGLIAVSDGVYFVDDASNTLNLLH